MSWQESLVIVACIAGAVALVRVVLPYVVARGEAERKAKALDAMNKRLDDLESSIASRRLPTALPGRRTA